MTHRDFSWLREAATGAGVLNVLEVHVQPQTIIALLDELDALRAAAKPVKAKDYPPDFLRAWEQYPARPGSSKAATFKAWNARINAGASTLEMMHGARQYAAYVLARGTEPEFIKTAQVFFGPGEHFASDWTVRAPQQPSLGKAGQATAQAAQDWMGDQ